MNKKIKVIELWNINAQIEDSKKIPQKIKYNGAVYELQMSRDYYSYEKHEYLTNMANNKRLDIFLNDYVKILEDNTEEIEELDLIKKENIWDKLSLCEDKINELVRAIKDIRKDLKNE